MMNIIQTDRADMIVILHVRDAASVGHLKKIPTPMRHGKSSKKKGGKQNMNEHCMTDIFEECFRDCPNCPRAMYKADDDGWNADFNDDNDTEEEYE